MLWDIPWGSTPEEVRRLAKENANVSLVPIRSDDVDLWQGLQKVSMFGYPVSVIQFLFDHNEKLYDVEIGFKKFSDDSKQMIAEAAGMAVEDICIQISEKYGDLTLGEFAAQKEKGDKQIQYQFPMAEEKIDYRLIMQAALEQRHIRLYIYWDNFLFRLFVEEKDNQYEISMYLSGTNETFYALMKEGSEVLPIYPKDPLFQTMKEIVDGTGPDINVGI